MSVIRKLVLELALKRCQRAPTPEKFTLSSENNFYTVYFSNRLHGANNVPQAMFHRYGSKRAQVRLWSGTSFGSPVGVGITRLKGAKVQIVHVYGHQVITYPNLLTFWAGEIFKFCWIRSFISWVSRRYFEATTRFRHERVFVLRKLVEAHFRDEQVGEALLYTPKELSVTRVFEIIYGQRAFAISNYKQEAAQLRFVLESLVSTGEIEKADKHYFRLTGEALSEIARYELEERRHRDSVGVMRLLVLLTFFLALAGLIEAASILTLI